MSGHGDKKYWSVKELAARWNMSIKSVRRIINDHKDILVPRKFRGVIRVSDGCLMRYEEESIIYKGED